jgi:pimeloyl-ACP methyl ester carboxylesterase
MMMPFADFKRFCNFRQCGWITLCLLTLLCFACQPCSAQADATSNVPRPLGRLIDLGGYKLHLNCTGRGTPVVILSAGAGDFSFDWTLVQSQVATFTRVCSYDRGGEAWSDLGPKPRTMYQEVLDLERLLAAGWEQGPFVLVGQSLGGMIARIFAMRYPRETAGLVLVDSFHEDAQLSMNGKLVRIRTIAKDRPIPDPRTSVTSTDALTPEETDKIQDMIKRYEGKPTIGPPFDKLPSDVQQDRLWALSQLKHYAAGDDYLPEEAAKIYVETATRQFPLGNLPVIVLSRSRDEYPPDVSAVLSQDHKDQQASLAKLSSKGREVIVPASGHHIQLDAPDAVTSAIQAIVNQNRK